MSKILRIGHQNYRVPRMVTSGAVLYSKRLGPVLEFLGPLLAFMGFLIVYGMLFLPKLETNGSNASTPKSEPTNALTPVAPEGGGRK